MSSSSNAFVTPVRRPTNSLQTSATDSETVTSDHDSPPKQRLRSEYWDDFKAVEDQSLESLPPNLVEIHHDDLVNLNLTQLWNFGTFINREERWPGCLTDHAISVMGILFGRRNILRCYDNYLNHEGKFDSSKMINDCSQFRKRGGGARNGAATQGVFTWSEFGVHILNTTVTREEKEEHTEGEDFVRALEQSGTFVIGTGDMAKVYINCRACGPMKVYMDRIYNSVQFQQIVDNERLPLVILRNFIFQSIPASNIRILSSQDGFNNCDIILVGSTTHDGRVMYNANWVYGSTRR